MKNKILAIAGTIAVLAAIIIYLYFEHRAQLAWRGRAIEGQPKEFAIVYENSEVDLINPFSWGDGFVSKIVYLDRLSAGEMEGGFLVGRLFILEREEGGTIHPKYRYFLMDENNHKIYRTEDKEDFEQSAMDVHNGVEIGWAPYRDCEYCNELEKYIQDERLKQTYLDAYGL